MKTTSTPLRWLRRALVSACLLGLAYLAFGLYSMSWGQRLLAPVKKGMTMSQVRSLVGNPVTETDRGNGGTTWDYNRWFWTDARVYFDPSGLVLATETD